MSRENSENLGNSRALYSVKWKRKREPWAEKIPQTWKSRVLFSTE